MKKLMMTLLALATMNVAMAQNVTNQPPRRMDAATLTTMLTKRLGLSSEQQTKVAELNKKYESLLVGPGMRGGRPPRRHNNGGGMSEGTRPELTEAQKAEMKKRHEQRMAYEKELKAILTEDQYNTYQQMRPHRGPRGMQRQENAQ